MRELTRHWINDVNRGVTILASESQDGDIYVALADHTLEQARRFQGEVLNVGSYGMTNEALLVILIDRFERAQRGARACPENDEVLSMLEGILAVLTLKEMRRESNGG